MRGFQLSGATLGGAPLTNLRVEHGELVAEQGGVTLHGDDLLDAHLYAQVRNTSVVPTATATVEYRITAVEEESAAHDPTGTGETYVYTLEQNVDGTSWQPACPVDTLDQDRRGAIPLTAIWDERGDRIASSTLFTFACTTGAIGKCYRWGYRPWVTGYGDLVATHWACTRAARADYCGNGTSHTRDGTLINLWDNLPAPGPIQARAVVPPTMVFEAGWDTGGAVCLSRDRWALGGPLLSLGCPGRLVLPILGLVGGAVCELLGQSANARLFNESFLNLNLDLF